MQYTSFSPRSVAPHRRYASTRDRQEYTDVFGKMKKILISIDDRLLERLDHEATALGISRSALIGQMLAVTLGEPVSDSALPG